MAEVQRLFDFLEFRTFAERLAEALGPAAVVLSSRRARAARRRGHRQRVAGRVGATLLASLDAARPRRRRGRARPGAAPLPGSPSSPTATPAAVTWIPADHLDDAGRRRRARPRPPCAAHDAKALMRSLLARAASTSPGWQLDTAIAAYLLDPAEARYELRHLVERYTRFAAAARRAGGQGPARPRRHAGRPVDRRRARGARRAPARRADHDASSASRAWPTCTPRSRTRSCGCWPGWSTPASPSTSPTCASCTTA